MASLSWSSWWAELRASRRMSVSFISFSLSSLRSCITVSASLSRHSDNLCTNQTQQEMFTFTLLCVFKCFVFNIFVFPACDNKSTHSWLECVFLSMWPGPVVPLWGSFGEDGREESVISSMSEWEEADFGDFFLLNACLKELRNCRYETQQDRRRGDGEWKRNTAFRQDLKGKEVEGNRSGQWKGEWVKREAVRSLQS